MKHSGRKGEKTPGRKNWFELNLFLVVGDSQFQDEDDVGAALVHVVQRHDVGVQDLLQDAHLPLHLLPPHAPPAGQALTLLDELGGVLEAGALLFASLDDGKLPAVDTRGGGGLSFKVRTRTLIKVLRINNRMRLRAKTDVRGGSCASKPDERWR